MKWPTSDIKSDLAELRTNGFLKHEDEDCKVSPPGHK